MVGPELSFTGLFSRTPILPCSVPAKVNHMPVLTVDHALLFSVLVVLLGRPLHLEYSVPNSARSIAVIL